MKSDFQPRPSGSRGGARSAKPGAIRVLSERQTQAYLLARDTIRRIQRSSSMFERNAASAGRPPGTGGGGTTSH